MSIIGVGSAPIVDAQRDSRVIAVCNPDRVPVDECKGSPAATADGPRAPWVHIHNVKIRNRVGNDPYPTGLGGPDLEAGGGIFVGAHTTLWLTDADVSDNEARNFGGGIFNAGTLRVERSTIANNRTTFAPARGRPGSYAHGCGGGVCVWGIASAEFERTLIEGNSAWIGGGIGTVGAVLHLRNSTLSRNRAAQAGGGVFMLGRPSQISFTTITDNLAFCHVTFPNWFCDRSGFRDFGGGGLYINTMTVLGNSIVADNIDRSEPNSLDHTPDCKVAVRDALMTAGNNVIGGNNVVTRADGCPRLSTAIGSFESDRILSDGDDPGLGRLADNGGPTRTHALKADSPAIGAVGFDTSGAGDFFRRLDIDQRGFRRPGPGRLVSDPDMVDKLDAGAYEARAFSVRLASPDIRILPYEVAVGQVIELLVSVPGDRAFNRPLRAISHDKDVLVSEVLRTTDASAMVRLEVGEQAPIGPRSLVIEVGEDTFEVPIWVVLDRERAESVAVDIMPGTCPNTLTANPEGRLRAAILGSDKTVASAIDPATVRLQGVAPSRTASSTLARRQRATSHPVRMVSTKSTISSSNSMLPRSCDLSDRRYLTSNSAWNSRARSVTAR